MAASLALQCTSDPYLVVGLTTSASAKRLIQRHRVWRTMAPSKFAWKKGVEQYRQTRMRL